jgi:hypothetical protein
MPNAVLTEEEKARIRYHLGYPQTDPVASIQLGVPRASQPMFLVEGQMNRIPESAIALVRRCTAFCDATELRILESQERLAARSVDEVDMNPTEPDDLRKEYRFWVQRLADVLGAPINPYAAAFTAGASPLNVNVIH